MAAGLSSQAQSHKLDWIRTMHSASSDIQPTSVFVDGGGMVYLTGYFRGTADFMPGPAVFNKSSNGGKDIFMGKYDPNGMLMWVYTFGGPGDDWGTGIDVSPMGNIHLTGVFNGIINMSTTATFTIGAGGVNDIFSAKYNMDARLQWAYRLGSIEPEETTGIKLDPAGNVYQAGNYRAAFDMNPGFGTANTIVQGMSDMFVCKWSENAIYQWGRSFGSALSDTLRALTLDKATNVYVAGTYGREMDVDPGAAIVKAGFRGGDHDFFVSKFDALGNFKKSVNIGSSGNEFVRGIAVDDDYNLYLAGDFEGTVDFNPNDTVAHELTAKGSRDAFLMCLDSAFQLKWVRSIGDTGASVMGIGVGVDFGGSPYLAGMFTASVDLDPSDSTQSFSSKGGWDIFTNRFDTSGKLIWAKAYGGKADDSLKTFYIHQSSAVYSGGCFRDTVDFDPGPNSATEIAASSRNGMFVSRWANCIASFDTIVATVCDSFVFAGKKFTSSGVYHEVIASATNCDSAVELRLSISPALNRSVSKSTVTLTSAATGCTYQWYNCDTKKLLPGATAKSYIAIGDGNYAVILDNGICLDTSDCMEVTGVPKYNGIREIANAGDVRIYPNPSKGSFYLDAGTTMEGAQVTIINSLGQQVRRFSLSAGLTQQELPSGFYLIQLSKNELQFSRKLIVE